MKTRRSNDNEATQISMLLFILSFNLLELKGRVREIYNLLYGGDMNDPIHNFTLRYHCIGGGHGVNRPDRRHSVYADRRRFNRVYCDFLRTVQKEKEVLTRPLSFRLLRSN